MGGRARTRGRIPRSRHARASATGGCCAAASASSSPNRSVAGSCHCARLTHPQRPRKARVRAAHFKTPAGPASSGRRRAELAAGDRALRRRHPAHRASRRIGLGDVVTRARPRVGSPVDFPRRHQTVPILFTRYQFDAVELEAAVVPPRPPPSSRRTSVAELAALVVSGTDSVSASRRVTGLQPEISVRVLGACLRTSAERKTACEVRHSWLGSSHRLARWRDRRNRDISGYGDFSRSQPIARRGQPSSSSPPG